MDEILDTVNKYDSSSKTTGKSTRSTADDTKAQVSLTPVWQNLNLLPKSQQ